MEIDDYKRPDHNDFKDFYELRKEKFSGIRHNSISQEIEIWLDGEIKGRCAENNVDEYQRLYNEIFGLRDSELS